MSKLIQTLKLPVYYGKLLLLVLQCKALLINALVQNGFRTRRILTLPDRPHPHTALYKICHRLGYLITQNETRKADVVIFWEDSALRRECPAVQALAQGQRVINYHCKDIRKRRVAEAFQEAFGYGLTVSPLEHHGPMVRKSDGNNGCHDGAIINGPAAQEETGFVYQRVVNNIEGDYVRDVRIPFFAGHMPYGLDKSILINCRFNNEMGSAVVRDLRDLMTQDEIASIRKFCTVLGLDYGELDVLRDRSDGRLYIVDANNCPHGPIDQNIQVGWYFDRVSWQALGKMCDAFRDAFIEPQVQHQSSAVSGNGATTTTG